MKMKKWNVKLIRKVHDDFLTIAENEAYAFDDDCLNQNLYNEACEIFKNIIEDKDIIRIDGNEVEYLEYELKTGDGIVLK